MVSADTVQTAEQTPASLAQMETIPTNLNPALKTVIGFRCWLHTDTRTQSASHGPPVPALADGPPADALAEPNENDSDCGPQSAAYGCHSPSIHSIFT